MPLSRENDAGAIAGENPLGLSEDEIRLLDKQVHTPASDAGYLSIFRLANGVDLLVMAVCALLAATAGSAIPLMTVVFGSLTGKFTNFTPEPGSEDDLVYQVRHLVLYFVYIGIGSVLAITFHVFGFTWTGQRISKRLREAYLSAILAQEISFFDTIGGGEITTRITADMSTVLDGISQKVGLAISGLGALIAAEIIAFVSCWRLALVMLCLPVVVTLWMMSVGRTMKVAQRGAADGYASTATLAEEVLSAMRTIIAHGAQHRFAARYERSLAGARAQDFRAKALLGLFLGGMMWCTLSAYALSCWAGSQFLNAGDATVGKIVTVLFASVIAGVGFGMVAPHFQSFAAAGAAANRIFAVIDRKSSLPADCGHRLETVNGHIVFESVKFVYPSRRQQLVLDNFNLDIPARKTTAIVGPSGSGKTTLFALLERFYCPLRGCIHLDGHDIQELSLPWLRSQIGVVSQESFLFNTTVFDNIAYGLIGTEHATVDDATKAKMVEEAARIANAHEFISELPQGYQTFVGDSGSLLSGGQRQRVAIARAIVSNPKILLLDEATASLDVRSEAAIQVGLKAATMGRTTVVIAHRLSTIRDADKIVVLDHGRITEQGTHADLIAKGGTYASFVAGQVQRSGSTGGEKKEHQQACNGGEETNVAVSKEHYDKSHRAQVPTTSTASRMELIKFLWNLNGPEKPYIFVGFIGSVLGSLSYPVTAILFGNLVLALHDPTLTLGSKSVNFWAGMQWLLAWVVLAGYVIQNVPLALASSRLVARARSAAFNAVLRQDMSFFATHSSGALTAFLALQANQLNGLSGAVLAAVLNSGSTVVIGFVIAVSFGWKLGLVAGATMPVVVLTGYTRFHVLSKLEARAMRSSDAAGIVAEAIRGIRTIAALGVENVVVGRYRSSLQTEFKTATTYSAQAAGTIFSYAPDVAGAQEAAQRLKTLLETVPTIDAESTLGESAENLKGDLQLCDVEFAYPSRSSSSHLVLNGVTLSAEAGTFVALVGASGSGKSTVLALLERFYDPQVGCVNADGLDIKRYRLQKYRAKTALVEQDAAIFGGTIRENIMSDSEVEEAEIEQACRTANIWEFVQSMPDGLNTLVGSRGSQISGGQRQRLAIARAVLRKPRILLLDEATSSLDSSSEAAVQEALSTATIGRTTISVAHRLSSIDKADQYFCVSLEIELFFYGISRARKLSAYFNVAVLEGDMADPKSIFTQIPRSASPVWGVYSVQVNSDDEEAQGKALVDVAVEHGVQHFVYSSGDRGGPAKSAVDPTSVRNFAAKFHIEKHLEAAAASSPQRMSYTILRPVTFFENLTNDVHGRGFARMWEQMDASKRLQMVATRDIGWFAAQAFMRSQDFSNVALTLVGDELTPSEAAEVFRDVVGMPMPLAPCPVASAVKFILKGTVGDMFRWFERERYGGDIIECRRLYPQMQDFRAWIEENKDNWAK
ncbi:hypothetical protein VTK73DRAFT_7064 [Phialemonium thermophilum]|uniref:ATP-binding cassette, subfamily B n=1 Tax=Phialemonium thermophilum TaxID=223376 RepID=A0ABR3WGS7_9PEZI